MIERRKALAVIAVFVFLSNILSFYAGAAGLIPQLNQLVMLGRSAVNVPAGLDMGKLKLLQQHIQSEFVDPITADKLTEGALKGMVEATGDKYSTYFNPQEYKQFVEHFEPNFSGIGVQVELSPKTGFVTVVAPIKGSPGERAGLRPGDAIVKVDATDLSPPISLNKAVSLIRGPKGSQVTLTVRREGVAEPMVLAITRATIEMSNLEATMVDRNGGIGHIQVREFNKDISIRLSKAISDLKREGMTRLILDLRQNPGGLLEEAIMVSSIFAPLNQPVMQVVYRNGEKETHFSRGKDPFDLPLVLLIDGGSASASEIVAGAVKDLKLGTLMGTTTFGKGSVQSFFDLTPDRSGVKLTTARWLTAGGNSIHEQGISPDIEVKNPQRSLPGDPDDTQLQEAVTYIKTMKR